MATSSTSDATRRSSKRVSTLPSAPKAPTSIDPAAVIANHAILTGIYPIKIGPRAVIHQYAKIVSGDGPIEIGEGCIIWEKVVIGNAKEEERQKSEGEKNITLGSNVVIETGAVVEAESIGESTIVEAFAKVGEGAVIGRFCKIVPYTGIPPHSTVPDFTVVTGENEQRRDTTMISNSMVHEIKAMSHKKQLKALQALIPNNLAKWQT